MILDEILSQRNSEDRLLFITQIITIAKSCTILSKSLVLALQSSEIDDAIAMLAIETEMSEESTEKASNADLEHLVKSMKNLSLMIDQAASYIKNYESSTKKLLNLYKSKEIIKMIEKHDKDLKVKIDWSEFSFFRERMIYFVMKRNQSWLRSCRLLIESHRWHQMRWFFFEFFSSVILKTFQSIFSNRNVTLCIRETDVTDS